MADKYDALEKLQALLEKGTITEEEFQKEKALLLAGGPTQTPIMPKDLFGLEENTYTMLIHLSAVLIIVNFLFAGLMAFLFWIFFKDKNINVDNHGRVVFNWLLTLLSAFLVVAIIFLILFSRPMHTMFFGSFFFMFWPIALLLIAGIIQAVVGAVKANQGQLWRYPLSIPFLKMRT
jgi:uncharacterized Tic20 family protein